MPLLDPRWTQQEIVEKFCLGELLDHKTVLDFLYLNVDADKICSDLKLDLSLVLVKHRHAQKAAFFFYLMKTDPVTRREALGYDATADSDVDDVAMLRRTFKCALSCLRENDYSSRPEFIAPTWLPAMEAYLKTILSTEEDLEDFFGALAMYSYGEFERCSDTQPTRPWRSILLSIAVHMNLYSYVREHLDGSEKPGRPLQHYCAGVHPPKKRLRDILLIRHMLFKGYDINANFEGRTTGEYLLLCRMKHESSIKSF